MVALASALVAFGNQGQQRRIGLRPDARLTTGLRMEAAARDVQRRAQLGDGIFCLHRFYPFKPLPGGLEIMPKVFLECPAAASADTALVAAGGSPLAVAPTCQRPVRRAAP